MNPSRYQNKLASSFLLSSDLIFSWSYTFLCMLNLLFSPLDFCGVLNWVLLLLLFGGVVLFCFLVPIYHASHSLFQKALDLKKKKIKYLNNTAFFSLVTTPYFSLPSLAKFRIALFALTKFAKFGAQPRYGGFFQDLMRGWEHSDTETMVIINNCDYIIIMLISLLLK